MASIKGLPSGLAVLLAATLAGAGCAGDRPAGESQGSATPAASGAPSLPAPSPTVRHRADLEAVFTSAGVQGTFVLYDVTAESLIVVNERRAVTALTPASTFKIPHSLIALETGVVKDETEPIPYGGSPQPIKEWERDMGLRDAVQVSNVAVFQEIARRVGAQREGDWLRRLGYGNATVGAQIDQFWLDGSLRISAQEQAIFLRRLARQELPASKRNQEIVRSILQSEKTSEYTLFAKTGTTARVTPQVGWWVGWIERSGRLYTFALNLDLGADPGPAQRIALAKDLLRRLNVVPGS